MPRVIQKNKQSKFNHKFLYFLASIPILSNLIPAINVFALTASSQEDFNFSIRVYELSTLLIEMPSSLVLDLTPEYATTKLGSEDLDIYVSTTNTTGYRLYMTTTKPELTGNFELSNGSTPAINTLPDTTTGYTEAEFGADNNNDVINKWGYTLTNTHLTSTDTNAVNNYLGVKQSSVANGDNTSGSTIGNTVIDNTAMILNNYSDESNRDKTTVTFAANIDAHMPAGTYDTTLTFTAITNTPVPDCAVGSICYDANGVTSESKMADQTVETTVDNGVTTYNDTTLWASNFKNPSGINGYGFAGWNTKADGTGTNYGPNETITPGDLSAEGLTLYANWIPADKDYTMQTFNSTACNNLTSGQVISLRDIRDDNVYSVAKLADGKCWMIENLRLGSEAELSSANTNVPSDWAGMVNEYGGSTSNRLTAPSTTAEYWCTTTNSAACYDQSRSATQNVSDSIGFMSASEPTNSTVNTSTEAGALDNNIYSYGNYYNWYSATAGNGTWDVRTRNSDVFASICPNTWRLPTGGASDRANVATTSDFWKLGVSIMGMSPNNSNNNNTFPYYDASSSATTTTFADKTMAGLTATKAFLAYPNNFLFSGYQNGASTNNRGTRGSYWSYTTLTTQSAYLLTIDTSNVRPGTHSAGKNLGFSIRCVIGS